MAEAQQIVPNSLVKVLAYDLYEFQGKTKIHVLDVLKSAHPGHRLGNPREVLPAKDDHDLSSVRNSQNDSSNDDDGLQKLYSCYYPLDKQAKDSKIPRTGWQIEQNGAAPAPRCTWIPATFRRFGDISRCNSEEEGNGNGNQ